jgi:hypothetical protein
MSYTAIVYKVMIASPSDVGAERSVVREVVGRWNNAHSDTRSIVLMPVGWETHSAPEMGDRPQTILNRQISTACDLLVGVFWTRIGTATGEYASGSVEEIEEHMKAGKPTMLYFSTAPVVYGSVDRDQFDQLMAFKESCRSRGIYEEYSDLADFRQKFDQHLQIKINRDRSFVGLTNGSSEQGESSTLLPARPVLSREAQVLLKEAIGDGQILHVHFIGGTTVQAGGKNLAEDSARSVAIWEGALSELEDNRLVQSADPKRQVFRVTRDGYDLADQLNP